MVSYVGYLDYDPNQVQTAPVEIPLDVRMRSKILK